MPSVRVDALLFDSFIRKAWHNQGGCAITNALKCNVLARWRGQLMLF